MGHIILFVKSRAWCNNDGMDWEKIKSYLDSNVNQRDTQSRFHCFDVNTCETCHNSKAKSEKRKKELD